MNGLANHFIGANHCVYRGNHEQTAMEENEMNLALILSTVLLLQSKPILTPSKDALTASIMRIAPRFRGNGFRRKFAGWYASRILIEAKRRNLDPITMTAIAWTESHFRPWARGVPGTRRYAEVGVWQLIPYNSPVRAARRTLEGCNPPLGLARWLVRTWKYRMRFGTCEDQMVANRRKKPGSFSIVELRDHVISTYVAAHEMRSHIDSSIHSRIRPRLIRGCKLPRKKQREIYRYGHYNSGPRRPKRYYVYRICKRHWILRNQIVKHNRSVRIVAKREVR